MFSAKPPQYLIDSENPNSETPIIQVNYLMEEAAEQQLPCRDLRQVKGKRCLKRKLVQSVLFSQGAKDGGKDEENEEGSEDEKDEDWCNLTKKRQKKPPKGRKNNNSKAVSQSKTPKKVTVSGKEISNKNINSTYSPVMMKSDFFMKISERRQQNIQQNESSIVSLEGNDLSCLSPNSASVLKQQPVSKSDEQQRKRTTKAKKKLTNSRAKKLILKRSRSESVSDKQTMHSFPNLSLESKMTAEENSCSAEKPLYPIFLGRNVNKRNQEITVMKEGQYFNPIHVFEADKDDKSSLDWRDLMFSQGSFPDFKLGQVSTSVTSERSVNSLQFDDFTICYPSTSSTCPDKMSLDQRPCKLIEENGNERLDSVTQVLSSCQDSEADWKFNCIQQGNCDMPENSLWTDKYQPIKATELCGNGESVKFISEWLCLWHEKGCHTWSSFEDQNSVNNTEYSCSLSDADSESIDGETSLKNVLLVTGPVGSGKSAAIYACAKEQGFQIIEVNTSDLRTGALVKQRFGEALESHWLQHKADNIVHSEMKSPVKSTPGITNLNNGSKSDFVELMQLSDGEDSQQAYQNSCRSIGRQNIDELKTLIFFEDVDATLSEDHGLFSTIKQLAQTAKRPMILSANKYNLALPQNLDRLEVQFTMPTLKELNTLGYMVCAAENARIDACLMDRMIEYCQCDIRKTIMNLQFWCQSHNSLDGDKLKVAFSPFLFDLEAGHQLLPKLISWSCPSQLSELIEEEITKSLQMMEESNNLVEIVVEEETKRTEGQNSSRMCSTRSDWVENKKEEMLNLNCSLQVEDDLLCQSQSTPQFPDISSSPVGFAKRNIRRRLGAVVLSDSDEDHFHDGPSFFGCGLDTNCGIQGVESNTPPSFAIESCCFPNEQLSPSDGYKLKRRSIKCSGTSVSPPDVNSMYNLADVSSVSESSAISKTVTISETGLFSATVSYSPDVRTEDVDSMRNYLSPSLSPTEHEKLLKPVHKGSCTPCSYSDSDKATLHGELIGDSRIVHGEDVARVYQGLDECSSCVFARTVKNFEKPRSHCQFNNVEETWQRLRNCHMDLKHLVTPEQKDVSHCLNLAFGMTDMISDADLLLSYCQPHLYDLLESSASLHGKTHSYSWYDDQLQMSSTISQHAICFYAKEAAVLGLNGSCCGRVDLALEMLLSSTNTMSLGKLLTLDKKILKSKDLRTPINSTSLKRWKDDSSLCEVIQSVVSKSAHLTLQGNSFHEYLSSLSQISRSETSQSSSSKLRSQRKQRRRQTTEHYLSSGTYSLSPEDILLLNQCNSYRKEVN